MTTQQLLIYQQIKPLSKEDHGNWSVKTGQDYHFAKTVNAAPLTLNEFFPCVREYPVVFIENNDSLLPVAIIGLEQQQNLYVTDDGQWQGQYIPAFFRRYPFIFALTEDQKMFTLCIDDTFSGFNQEGRGERLFDAEGEQTHYLKGVLNFLRNYQAQFEITQQLCRKLKELNLLEAKQVKIKSESEEPFTLSGFLAVDREKLKQLSGEQLAEFMQLGLLELIYLHLQSLSNFQKLAELKNKNLVSV